MSTRALDSDDDVRDQRFYAIVFVGIIVAALIATGLFAWSATTERGAPAARSTPVGSSTP